MIRHFTASDGDTRIKVHIRPKTAGDGEAQEVFAMKVYRAILISILFLAGLVVAVFAAEPDLKGSKTGGWSVTADQQREVYHVS
jgi:hypothetical protein